MKVLFLLFTFATLICSAPTSCNFQKTNVLSEESLGLKDKIYQINQAVNPECYLKNICTIPCQGVVEGCRIKLYRDMGLSGNDLYKKYCLNLKKKKVQELMETIFKPYKLELIHSYGKSHYSLGSLIEIGEKSNNFASTIEKFESLFEVVRRLCASPDMSPSKKLKELFGKDLSKVEPKLADVVDKFIKKASVILAEDCECITFYPLSVRLRGEYEARKECNKVCRK